MQSRQAEIGLSDTGNTPNWAFAYLIRGECYLSSMIIVTQRRFEFEIIDSFGAFLPGAWAWRQSMRKYP